MDPVVATVLVVAVFAVGIYVGWLARGQSLLKEIKRGDFDPYNEKWGRDS